MKMPLSGEVLPLSSKTKVDCMGGTTVDVMLSVPLSDTVPPLVVAMLPIEGLPLAPPFAG